MNAALQQLRWQAVVARDALQDGRFVYAVTSTGVFCRPSCPARRPRPERVRFFDAAALAAGAGFRPCRRCRPDSPGPASAGAAGVWQALERVRAADGAVIPLAELARTAGLSPWHFQRTFRRLVGVTPRELARGLRQARLKASLQGGRTVTEAIYDAGYGAPSRMYEERGLGMRPAAFARGGAGERVAWTSAATPFGRLLVAATARGLVAVMLGTDEAALAQRLARELPRAQLVRDPRALHSALAPVVALLAGSAPSPALPTDVRATSFQLAVWRELSRIPRGETRSYGEIARRLGRPQAARAVANACARNPLALVVPCHRAVRGDGAAGGYRWGRATKEKLLAAERHQASSGKAARGRP